MSEQNIFNQLVTYCDCVEADENDVNELITLVSMITGWMAKPCDDFLFGARREVVELPSCLDCPMEFRPFYHPYDVDSFSFTLVKVDGLEETSTAISDYAYSEVDELFRIDPGLPSCKCAGSNCGCEPTYKLLVTYDAGYDSLPECLLPVFCNLLEVIHAKRTCDCSCDTCDSTYGPSDNQPVVKYKSGDVVSVFLENDLGKVLVEQYKNQLAMLNLYRTPPVYWGEVV